MKCPTCTNIIKEEEIFCSNCLRKIHSDNYMIEYCPNCMNPICIIQEKAIRGKYKEYKGRCPKCKLGLEES